PSALEGAAWSRPGIAQPGTTGSHESAGLDAWLQRADAWNSGELDPHDTRRWQAARVDRHASYSDQPALARFHSGFVAQVCSPSTGSQDGLLDHPGIRLTSGDPGNGAWR